MSENLEDVQRDISAFKGEKVFACNPDESCGYEDERCICRDPEVKPWTRCPVHDAVTD